MSTTATYSHAREHLAKLWDEIEDSQDPIILRRRGHEDMAILPARELRSLQETAHLLRSPRNAARLLAALNRSKRSEGTEVDLESLAREFGLDPER